MDEELFGLMLDENMTNSSEANGRARLLAEHMDRACDAAVMRKRNTFTRKPA